MRKRPFRGIAYRAGPVLTILTILAGFAGARSLPKTDYFIVHSKGFSSTGISNRDASRLWVLQFRFTRGKPTGVKVIKSYRTQYGLKDEPKRRRGDRSTPEGVYNINILKRHRRDHLTGPWNFLVDYPNKWDRKSGRTGSAIGIHGGPNRRTLGCIRLRDRERGGSGTIAITELRKYVRVGTPVISLPHLPAPLMTVTGKTLGKGAAEFYAHLLTASLSNKHVVKLVNSYAPGSKAYLAETDKDIKAGNLVTVSSELDPFGSKTYRAYNLTDGDPRTCWSEGAVGSGKGEWAQIRFPEPRSVRRIKLINGYSRANRWKQNNRVKRLSVRLSDGSSYSWKIRDTRTWQSLTLPAAVTTRYVMLTIEDVYRGDRKDWNDTSISEIAVDASATTTSDVSSASPTAPSKSAAITASASSVLDGGTASGYNAYNVIDGNTATCWSEGEDGRGKGEWLQLTFNTTRTLSLIRVVNGYAKGWGPFDRWKQNARVKRAMVRFSDGTALRWTLADTREWQSLTLPRPVTTRFVRIIIEEAYPGGKWNDVSISEVAFVDAKAGAKPSTTATTTQVPSITASSTLDQATTDDYAPSNAMDGDLTTCWSEGATGATRQWIRFAFASPRAIRRIHVVNGYAKGRRWRQNSRVKKAVLVFPDGTRKEWLLKDVNSWQTLDLARTVTVRWVKLVIQSVYPGERWQDTSISEVRFDTETGGTTATRARTTTPSTSDHPTVSASSTLASKHPGRYAAENVLDGRLATCWSEGVSGDGIGERLRVEFNRGTTIRRISLVNGYTRSATLWRKNNRVRKFHVHFSDGSILAWTLKDTDAWQTITLPTPKLVFHIEFEIREITPGSQRRWHDTSISEMIFR
jgi:hypothetical protein